MFDGIMLASNFQFNGQNAKGIITLTSHECAICLEIWSSIKINVPDSMSVAKFEDSLQINTVVL